jgi:hypothetical protein
MCIALSAVRLFRDFARLAVISTIAIIAIAAAASYAGAELNAGAPLTMAVDPSMSFAPADFRVRLDVTPRSDNRFLVVVAESDEFYRGSELTLDAENAPRSLMVQFRGLPGGIYAVSGEVRDADGRRLAVVHQEVTVLPSAGSR